MALPADIANALYGAWRLAHFDRGGIAFFGHDERAFWRSFIAPLIAYPAVIVFLLLGVGDADAATIDWLRIFLVETIAYVIGCTAFPLIVLPVTRFLGREALWLDFVVVYNWTQLVQNVVMVIAVAFSLIGLAPASLPGALIYLVYVFAFAYEGFVARVVLDITWPAAGMIVLIDLVLGRLVSLTAESLH
jgi:hypothetical protein